MGAMCYDMALPPDHTEYTCPTCGEKTLYAWSQKELGTWNSENFAKMREVRFVQGELTACRREVEKIKQSTGLLLTLDESSFCKHCQPNATKHELKLTVTYTDGRTHTVSPVSLSDFRLLRDFFEGKFKKAPGCYHG